MAQLENNVINVATKQHNDKQLYERENIKETDFIEGGRTATQHTSRSRYKYI
jgi:hypothetical protein